MQLIKTASISLAILFSSSLFSVNWYSNKFALNFVHYKIDKFINFICRYFFILIIVLQIKFGCSFCSSLILMKIPFFFSFGVWDSQAVLRRSGDPTVFFCPNKEICVFTAPFTWLGICAKLKRLQTCACNVGFAL